MVFSHITLILTYLHIELQGKPGFLKRPPTEIPEIEKTKDKLLRNSEPTTKKHRVEVKEREH